MCVFHQGRITAQGDLIAQDMLMVADPVTLKFKERRIFMFEQIIIISEQLEKKKGFSMPGYVFKNSFQVGQRSYK